MSLVALSFLAAAQAQASYPPTALPDNPRVEAAVAALEAGETDELRHVFSGVDVVTMFDAPLAAQTPAEAIALLSGCDAAERDRRGAGRDVFYTYTFTCGEDRYFVGITVDDNGRSLSFFDVSTLADYDRQGTREFRPPAVPPPARLANLTDEQRAEMERRKKERQQLNFNRAMAVAGALASGNTEGIANRMRDDGRVTYAFFNPFLDQRFFEQVGAGPEAMTRQLARIDAELGKPVGYACELAEWVQRCSWRFRDEGTTLDAMFFLSTDRDNADWRIRDLHFRFVTNERLLEAAQRIN